MIGMTAQDRAGTIDLLGEHDFDEPMRPSRATEGEAKVGFIQERRLQPIRPADDKTNGVPAFITDMFDTLGEGTAFKIKTTFVQHDAGGVAGDQLPQSASLFGEPLSHSPLPPR